MEIAKMNGEMEKKVRSWQGGEEVVAFAYDTAVP